MSSFKGLSARQLISLLQELPAEHQDLPLGFQFLRGDVFRTSIVEPIEGDFKPAVIVESSYDGKFKIDDRRTVDHLFSLPREMRDREEKPINVLLINAG